LTRPVRISEQAAAKLAQAVRWYEAQRHGLGAELLDAISRGLAMLAEHSEIGQAFSQDTRIRQFPYRVIYRLGEIERVPVTVLHASAEGPPCPAPSARSSGGRAAPGPLYTPS